jgi:hypothetical protein
MLVLLDGEEYPSAEDRLEEDVFESIEESRECTMTCCWA